MKPPVFEYRAPSTIEEALEILAEKGWEAKVLAGGQSLVPAMNFRLADPGVLVDLNRIGDLAGIRETERGGIEIGAMTRQAAAEASGLVAERAPLLAEALPWVAHLPIRNRGTVGGSLAHADPAAELPAVAVALGASLEARSLDRGARRIDADDFWPGLFSSALEPDEILTAVEFPPVPDRSGFAFEELARRSGDFALVGVAVAVRLDEADACADARIALLSVADRPLLARAGSAALIDEAPTPARIAAAAAAVAAEDVDPPADIHASAAYRRHLSEVLVRRALERAFERAREQPGP